MTPEDNSAVYSGHMSAVYKTWIAALLAAYAKTGAAPNAYVQRSGKNLSEWAVDARHLVLELWVSLHPDAEDEARAWCSMVFGLSDRSMQRLAQRNREDPIDPRVLGHCRALIKQLRPRLTSALVRAAIGAGWTGCETRGVRPMREVFRLLQLVPTWLPEGSQPPDGPVRRGDW